MLGGALSSLPSVCVVVRCSWLVFFRACPVVRGLVASRAVVASFLLCLPRACLLVSVLFSVPLSCCLLAYPVSPYRRIARLPASSTSGAGRAVCVSVVVRPGLLLPVACRGVVVSAAWRFLSVVLPVAAVSMVSVIGVISVASVACRWSRSLVGVSRSLRSLLVACLFASFSSSAAMWCSRYCLRSSSPCLLRFRRRGSSWAVRRRVSSSVVPSRRRLSVARRRCLACPRLSSSVVFVPCRFRPPSLASSLVAAPRSCLPWFSSS